MIEYIWLFLFFGLFTAFACCYFYKKNLRISRSKYLHKKALLFYRKKDYNNTIICLQKGLIVPGKGIITTREASIDVQNLELLDLVLLQKNIDSDCLTLALRSYLSNVNGTARINEKYFHNVKLFYSKYTEDFIINQHGLNAIAVGEIPFGILEKRRLSNIFGRRYKSRLALT